MIGFAGRPRRGEAGLYQTARGAAKILQQKNHRSRRPGRRPRKSRFRPRQPPPGHISRPTDRRSSACETSAGIRPWSSPRQASAPKTSGSPGAGARAGRRECPVGWPWLPVAGPASAALRRRFPGGSVAQCQTVGGQAGPRRTQFKGRNGSPATAGVGLYVHDLFLTSGNAPISFVFNVIGARQGRPFWGAASCTVRR